MLLWSVIYIIQRRLFVAIKEAMRKNNLYAHGSVTLKVITVIM